MLASLSSLTLGGGEAGVSSISSSSVVRSTNPGGGPCGPPRAPDGLGEGHGEGRRPPWVPEGPGWGDLARWGGGADDDGVGRRRGFRGGAA